MVADSAVDAEADKLRARAEDRIDRLRDTVADAEQRARQLEEEASSSKRSELISVGGSVLGALFGGRRSARSITSAVGRVAWVARGRRRPTTGWRRRWHAPR